MLIGGVTSGESNDHLVRLLHILVANETNMGLNASNRPPFSCTIGGYEIYRVPPQMGR